MELANVMTLESLQSHPDYVCDRGIPVFRAHTKYKIDPKTRQPTASVKYRVTDDDLPEICENANRFAEEDAHLARQTIGHIRLENDSPESEQPAKLIGHAVQYRLGYIQGKSGPTKVILADLYTHKDHSAEAKNFPYRSSEYNWKTKRIAGVARLLRDPALGLGTVPLESDDETVCYAEAMGGEPRTVVPTDGPSDLQPDEAVQADRLWKYFKEKYPEDFGECEPEGGLPRDDQRPEADGDEEGKPKPPKGKKGDDSVDKAQVEKYEAEMADLRAENVKLKTDAEKSKVKVMLDALDTERYEYDREDLEVSLLQADDAGRARKVAAIRKNNKQKATNPGGDDAVVLLEGNSGVESLPPGGRAAPGTMTAEHFARANERMAKGDISWPNAISETKAK